jgi:hypothetical protein
MKNKYELFLFSLAKITDLAGDLKLQDFYKIKFKNKKEIEKTYKYLSLLMSFIFIFIVLSYFFSIYFLINKNNIFGYVFLIFGFGITFSSLYLNIKTYYIKK